MNIKIIVPIILVAVLGAGIGLLASQVWNPDWDPFIESGDRIIEKSIEKLISKETGEYQAEIVLNGEQNTDTFAVLLNLSGVIDAKDEENLKMKNNIGIALSSSEADISANIELLALGEIFYINLSSFSGASFLIFDESIIQGLTNKWIKIDLNEIKQTLGLEQDAETEQELESKSRAFLKDLQKIAKNKTFFDIEKSFGQEQVEEETTEHYLVSINKESIKEIIPEYINLMKKYELADMQSQMTEQEIEKALTELPANIDSLWQQLGGISFEAWVSQSSGALKKLKFQRELKSSDFAEIAEQGIEDTILSMNIVITFSNLGEPVTIVAPSTSQSIEDLLTDLLMSSLNTDLDTNSLPLPTE